MELVNYLKDFVGTIHYDLIVAWPSFHMCYYARLCAVFGGIYVLRRNVEKVVLDANNQSVLSSNESVVAVDINYA